MSDELNKCPNCNGSLIVKNNKKECPYCGEEFVIKQENQPVQQQNQNDDSGLTPAEKLFELINVQKSYASEKTWHTLETIFLNINKQYDLTAYYDYFKRNAKARLNGSRDIAAFDINRELLLIVKKRLQALLYENEEFYYYRDAGIISRGKEGLLYTNSRILFLTKRSTNFINYGDIKSFQSGKGVNGLTNTWYINNNVHFKLEPVGIDAGNLGIEIAYICNCIKIIQERHENSNYKIKIEFFGA